MSEKDMISFKGGAAGGITCTTGTCNITGASSAKCAVVATGLWCNCKHTVNGVPEIGECSYTASQPK